MYGRITDWSIRVKVTALLKYFGLKCQQWKFHAGVLILCGRWCKTIKQISLTLVSFITTKNPKITPFNP